MTSLTDSPTIDFDPALEDEYIDGRLTESWPLSRGLLLMSAPFFMVLAFHDNLVDPGSIARTWPIRLVTAVVFLLLFLIARRSSSLLSFKTLTALGFLTVSVGLGFVVAEVNDGFIWLAPGFILSLGLIAQGIDRGQARGVALVLVATPIVMYLIGGASSVETLSLTIFLVTGVAFSLVGMIRADMTNRRIFLAERALAEERDKVDRLVRNMVPGPIADRLKDGATTISDHFDDVTVMFVDVVGFTAYAEQHEPQHVVSLLNDLFSRFDVLATDLGVVKIKTLGDGYMVAGGIPEPIDDHATRCVKLAVEIHREVARFGSDHKLDWEARVGICTGPVVAGIIGHDRYAYDVWGDTVNIASRLESGGSSGDTRVSASTRSQLGDEWTTQPLGPVEMRNRAPVESYLVVGPASPIGT